MVTVRPAEQDTRIGTFISLFPLLSKPENTAVNGVTEHPPDVVVALAGVDITATARGAAVSIEIERPARRNHVLFWVRPLLFGSDVFIVFSLVEVPTADMRR